MSLPNSYRKAQFPLPGNSAAGVPSADLCSRHWPIPTGYRVRLFASLGGGTAEAVTVEHRFYLDDGFGDGERLVVLSTTLASGTEETDYLVVEGVALDLRVRVVTVPSTAPAAARQCVASAAVSEWL